jgi:hypothetical protein
MDGICRAEGHRYLELDQRLKMGYVVESVLLVRAKLTRRTRSHTLPFLITITTTAPRRRTPRIHCTYGHLALQVCNEHQQKAKSNAKMIARRNPEEEVEGKAASTWVIHGPRKQSRDQSAGRD